METIYKLFGRQLNSREQLSVAVAGGVIVLFIIFQLIIMPLVNKHNSYKERIASKKQTLNEMMLLKAQYEEFNKKEGDVNRRLKYRRRNFTLFSFMDELAGNVGIKANINYMKPKTTTAQPGSKFKKSVVEMKLEGVTTEQLTAYLHGVESSRNMIYVKRLTISKKNPKDEAISVVLQVETIEE